MFRIVLLSLLAFIIHPTSFAQQQQTERLQRFRKNGLYGFINSSRDTVASAQWDYADDFYAGKARVESKSKWGMINAKGAYVIPLDYDKITNVSDEGIVRLTLNGLIGYKHVDSGVMISAIQWQEAGPFYKGFAQVMKDNHYGIINIKGVVVCPAIYDFIGDISAPQEMVRVNKDEKFGYINATRKLVIPVKFSYAEDFSDGLALVQVVGSEVFEYIDKTGKSILRAPAGLMPGKFTEGYALVLKGNIDAYKAGFINKQGKIVIPTEWDEATEFYNGHAAVKRNGKWGFINKTGKLVVDTLYDEITPYSKQAKGKRNGRWESLFETEPLQQVVDEVH
jgi:hypothetical protein